MDTQKTADTLLLTLMAAYLAESDPPFAERVCQQLSQLATAPAMPAAVRESLLAHAHGIRINSAGIGQCLN
ncbi:MAG: hypothetical protein REI09_05305 [Candidatus Dactylopiibacterium sp.]|nr:hypothetical protein [Candidatus Dactylopiibacterium sp.]